MKVIYYPLFNQTGECLIARVIQRNDKNYQGIEVRCQGVDSKEIGIMPIAEAFERADDEGVELVEIAPNAKPPVVRLLDYGKYVYEQKKKEKELKKKQHTNRPKEVKFHVNIDEHDYQTKRKHAVEFLQKGHKLKITLQFRGREMSHRELGVELIKRLIEELSEVGQLDTEPKLQGRNYSAMMSPLSKK